MAEENKIGLLEDDLDLCKAKLTKKNTCKICFDDDISADQMFLVGKCRHQFCTKCVKRHIEVILLEGHLMLCLEHSCISNFTIEHCDNLLTPKLRAIWEQRIKEDSIPVTDRIYCPNPRCSSLMSKTEISSSTQEARVRKCCFQCSEPFCINCKVTWHDNLSCGVYKKLHPNPTENDEKLKLLAKQKRWRQCGKCQHMIQLSGGCDEISCRCGHEFCYQCGAEDGRCIHQSPIEVLETICVSIWVIMSFIFLSIG